MHPLSHISQQVFHVINILFPQVGHDHLRGVDITLNVDMQRQAFGDLSCNAALVLSKQIGLPPRDVACALQQAFQHEYVGRIEVAGPGFLNMWLTPFAFQQILRIMLEQGNDFFKRTPGVPVQKYSIEFVSANPTGPLHIGHGRNGIIGDVLSRITKFYGHEVVAEFYINDAGSQIDKLGQSLRVRCQQQLGQDVAFPEDGYQGEYLVQLASSFIQEYGVDCLQKHDAMFLANYAKNALLADQRRTLANYKISFDVWFSELSLITSGELEKSLSWLAQHGHLYEQDGALWFRSTLFGDDKDRVVRKSSGEFTYVASDIAYLYNKIERGFDHLVIVLGQDHHGYVGRLRAALSAFGRSPDLLHVILYQLVMLKNEGEALRLSKRAGRIINLDDLITLVGSDVARFFFLHRKADAHLEFDLSLALKHTDENPVYYVQYAYVRVLSILAKAQLGIAQARHTLDDVQYLSEHEHLLLKKMIALKGLIEQIIHSRQTHALTYYVLELAHIFHSYYALHRVIAPEQPRQTHARLLVMEQLRNTLAVCLDLLGVSKPEEM